LVSPHFEQVLNSGITGNGFGSLGGFGGLGLGAGLGGGCSPL